MNDEWEIREEGGRQVWRRKSDPIAEPMCVILFRHFDTFLERWERWVQFSVPLPSVKDAEILLGKYCVSISRKNENEGRIFCNQNNPAVEYKIVKTG